MFFYKNTLCNNCKKQNKNTMDAVAPLKKRSNSQWNGTLTAKLIKTKYEPWLASAPPRVFGERIVKLSQLRRQMEFELGGNNFRSITDRDMYLWARRVALDYFTTDNLSGKTLVFLHATYVRGKRIDQLRSQALDYRISQEYLPWGKSLPDEDKTTYNAWAARIVNLFKKHPRFDYEVPLLSKRAHNNDEEPVEMVAVHSLEDRLRDAEKKARLNGNFLDLSADL
jgi:hypothetical protein